MFRLVQKDPDDGFVLFQAEPEEVVPFSFEMQGKMRHHDSHEMRVHQVVVQVDGFEAVTPVSVDRVGTFFRMAKATKSDLNESPQVRIVFQVKLEGSARKLIVVRSALLASNLLPHPIELKLVNTAVRVGGEYHCSNFWYLNPGSSSAFIFLLNSNNCYNFRCKGVDLEAERDGAAPTEVRLGKNIREALGRKNWRMVVQ